MFNAASRLKANPPQGMRARAKRERGLLDAMVQHFRESQGEEDGKQECANQFSQAVVLELKPTPIGNWVNARLVACLILVSKLPPDCHNQSSDCVQDQCCSKEQLGESPFHNAALQDKITRKKGCNE